MAETTTLSAVGAIAEMTHARILRETRNATVIMPFVKKLPLRMAGTLKIPVMSNVISTTSIANGANEGDAVTPATQNIGSVDLQVAVRAAFIENTMQAQAGTPLDLNGVSRSVLARAAAAAMEVAAATAGATFTRASGTTGIPMDAALPATAVSALVGHAADKMRFAVGFLHSAQNTELTASALNGVGTSLSPALTDMLKSYGVAGLEVAGRPVKNADGVPLFVTDNVTDNGTDYQGFIMVPEAPPVPGQDPSEESPAGLVMASQWEAMVEGPFRRLGEGKTTDMIAVTASFAIDVLDDDCGRRIISGV